MTLPILTFPVPFSDTITLVRAYERSGTTAMTVNRMTWMEDWKKAKTRPRVSSSTSSPTMVKPVAYAIPDSAPISTTNRTTAPSTGTRPMSASGTAAAAIVRPNSRRRLKLPSNFVPRPMPSAMPTKIAAKTSPQPALPPCSV